MLGTIRELARRRKFAKVFHLVIIIFLSKVITVREKFNAFVEDAPNGTPHRMQQSSVLPPMTGKEWHNLFEDVIKSINNPPTIGAAAKKPSAPQNEGTELNNPGTKRAAKAMKPSSAQDEATKNPGTKQSAIAKEPSSAQTQASQEEKELWVKRLLEYLKETFNVRVLKSMCEVRLWGYAVTVERPHKCYFWKGKADAIGLVELQKNEYKYVIVDWKSQSYLDFWESSGFKSLPYKRHLHQCLVYARLLKMHMDLDYWPPILLVPFDSKGERVHPRLFKDYPDECKEAIEKYEWSTNQPLRAKKDSPLIKDENVKEGFLPGDMTLKDAFKEGATVNDLCKALKICKILVKD